MHSTDQLQQSSNEVATNQIGARNNWQQIGIHEKVADTVFCHG